VSEHERQKSGCVPVAFTLLTIGLLITLTGWLWHFPELTYTPGVVMESQRLPAQGAVRISYKYTAFGVAHHGERILWLTTQVQQFYQVGDLFPVYFVTAHPERSYGPNRPIVQPLIWVGLFLAAFGVVIIYFARPR
jgi:hypothetical protein